MTKQKTPYFSKGEKLLWLFSVASILLSFFLFDGKSFLTLAASLVGVTSLIFNAKGNPFGQVLMILFSLLYGVISYSFRYYGEMITYLGMTMPMAAVALVSWLRNPYRGNRAEGHGKPGRKKGISFYVGANGGSHPFLLLCVGLFSYREHPPQHPFGHHQLYRGVPYLSEKSLLRGGICRQ